MKPAPDVTLEQYAFVTAGVADGLPLEQLLARQFIRQRDWAAAENYWNAQLLDDLTAEGPMQLEILAFEKKAREHWTRPLPPLDTDLRAWLDFQRRLFDEDPDIAKTLAKHEMRSADLARLTELWGERIQRDIKIGEQTLAIWAEAPGPMPEVKPEPAQFKEPFTGTSVEPAPVRALPFKKGKDKVPPPPILKPLPKPKPKTPGIAETSLVNDIAAIAAAIPFKPSEPAPILAAPPSAPTPPVVPFQAPAPAPPPAPLPIAVPTPPVIRRPPAELQGTSLALGPTGPAMPFRPSDPAAPPPASVRAPAADPLSTLRLPAPALGATSAFVSPIAGPATPFQTKDPISSPPAPAPLAAPSKPVAAAPPTPAPLPTIPADWTVERYASLCVELELHPERAGDTLRRYQVTPEGKAKLDVVYMDRMARDARVWLAFDVACKSYRTWLKQQGGGK